ncbi:MAG: SDR family oxidoreductase [Pseudohongiellaceae bacterium]
MSTYLVTGSNRGIGLTFVKSLLTRGDRVVATCRNRSKASDLTALQNEHPALEILELDVADAASLDSFPARLGDTAIDVFISNAGVYGPRGANFGNLSGADWEPVLLVNAVAPVLLTQLIMDNLRQGSDRKLIYITSKMGSIDDNGGGGQYVYRSSKAALNAAVKSLSIDLADDGFNVLLLHPGWVQTDMGGPSALIDTGTSVDGMLQLIDQLGPAQNGQFLAYDGKQIPW